MSAKDYSAVGRNKLIERITVLEEALTKVRETLTHLRKIEAQRPPLYSLSPNTLQTIIEDLEDDLAGVPECPPDEPTKS